MCYLGGVGSFLQRSRSGVRRADGGVDTGVRTGRWDVPRSGWTRDRVRGATTVGIILRPRDSKHRGTAF